MTVPEQSEPEWIIEPVELIPQNDFPLVRRNIQRQGDGINEYFDDLHGEAARSQH